MMNKSIAILPFLNLGVNNEMEYFSDGITEEIINALSKIKELQVISRTSSFAFKNTQKTLKEIAEILNVSIVLEGSVRLSGTSTRITAQLINPESDTPFWCETFDRNLEDIFAIQDEISLLIADKLREHLGHFNMDDHLVEHYDIPFDIYKKYLKGRYHLMKLDYKNTMQAISIFKEVIEEYKKFPFPYLDINQAYAYMATMGIISPMEAYQEAPYYLEKAIELKVDLPETQLNLAWVCFWQQWNFKQAYIHLNKALSIKATDNMYLTMANFCTVKGKLDTAMKYLDKALDLAPLSAVNLNYKGFLYYMKEEYDTALVYYKQALELQPDLPFPVVGIGVCYLLLGKQQKGLDYFKQLPQDDTGYLSKIGGSAIADIITGNIEKAEKGIMLLEGYLSTESRGNALHFLILCHAQMNKVDKAIEYLKIGIKEHISMILLLPTEPLAAPLHNHPIFVKLLNEIIQSSNLQLEDGRKYKKSLFTDNELKKYKNRLAKLMKEEELYLNPELSLRTLAEYINLSPNHMSQLLNEGFEQNFSDYINTFRLSHFIQQLQENSSHHLTILGIAYDSGFNSKTVFNTFFKKKIGTTPKKYWDNLHS